MLGYQLAPIAMVSLLLGLGGGAFAYLGASVRIGLFVAGALWSLWLGRKFWPECTCLRCGGRWRCSRV